MWKQLKQVLTKLIKVKTIKLKINLQDYMTKDNKSKTITRTVNKKEESIYGVFYTLDCGWYVSFDNYFNRWEIHTLVKGEYIGRFGKDEIIEINK